VEDETKTTLRMPGRLNDEIEDFISYYYENKHVALSKNEAILCLIRRSLDEKEFYQKEKLDLDKII